MAPYSGLVRTAGGRSRLAEPRVGPKRPASGTDSAGRGHPEPPGGSCLCPIETPSSVIFARLAASGRPGSVADVDTDKQVAKMRRLRNRRAHLRVPPPDFGGVGRGSEVADEPWGCGFRIGNREKYALSPPLPSCSRCGYGGSLPLEYALGLVEGPGSIRSERVDARVGEIESPSRTDRITQ